MVLSGSQIIIQLLKQHGIRTVAGIPGGSILPLYDELYSSDIQHVLVRQEQAAGFIAQGIARVTGKAAVCMATSGPGAMNLLTSVADARCDSIPMVAITGQVNTSLIGTDAFQEADTFGLSFPITKHSMMVKSPDELLEAVPMAFAIAESGRPGPVLIDVPRNVQAAKCEVPDDFENYFDKIYKHYIESKKGMKYQTEEEKIPLVSENFAKMLKDAKKPVLYVGGGANSPRAAEKIAEFISIYNIPVVSSLMGIGVVSSYSENFIGMVGMHGSYAANRVMYEADLVLAAGARFDDRATGVVEKFCPNAVKNLGILHIDIDAAEVNKILSSSSYLILDCATAFTHINSALKKLDLSLCKADRDSWVKSCAETKKNEKTVLELGCDKSDCCGNRSCGVKAGGKYRNPRDFIASLPSLAAEFGLTDDDLIVATDVGQHQMWTAQFYPIKNPRQLLTSGSLGTMGFGLPAAIGAAMASPEKRVVCISGDGSILMNVQELATLSELGLNVTVIVLDNGCLGMVRQQQEYLFDKHYSASTFISHPDLLKVAEGFGIRTADADADSDWAKKAFGEKGPCFVRTLISRYETVLPFVKSGCANIDALR